MDLLHPELEKAIPDWNTAGYGNPRRICTNRYYGDFSISDTSSTAYDTVDEFIEYINKQIIDALYVNEKLNLEQVFIQPPRYDRDRLFVYLYFGEE